MHIFVCICKYIGTYQTKLYSSMDRKEFLLNEYVHGDMAGFSKLEQKGAVIWKTRCVIYEQ